MKKIGFIQKIIIFIISIILILTLSIVGLRTTRNFSVLGAYAHDAFILTFNNLFRDPITYISDTVNGFANFTAIYEENKLLKQELEQYLLMKNKYEEANRELSELKQLMEIENVLSDYSIKYGIISNRSIDGWNNFITVNLGENDGIKLNMAAVTNKGLIGKVYKVSKNNCVIKLLTSQDYLNKVSVKLVVSETESVDGILETYDLESGTYTISLINDTGLDLNDAKVLTNGLGGVFPSGLDVGTVVEVVKDPSKMQVIVKAKPSASFNGFSSVALIERKVDE